MKTITKSQYLYLKSKKNANLSKDETVTIEDEEYEDLIQYSNKQITPIDDGNDEPQEDSNHDYSQDYLTFEALEYGCQFSINNDNFQYSLDDGKTWIMLNKNEWTPSINKGQKIIWKQYGLSFNNSLGTYKSNNQFNVYGNIMSILYGDIFKNNNTLYKSILSGLFYGNNKIINAKNLILPTIILADYCYAEMFFNCKSLTTAPKLPATILAPHCYANMFQGCESLTIAPALPAITLADYCYWCMFFLCTSLTTAPLELPATSLTPYCYTSMFGNCESLITAPILPATKLAELCYQNMFYECESLTYIKCLSNNYSGYSFNGWVSGVGPKYITNKGIFIKLKDVEIPIGDNGIPQGWLVKELDPDTMEVVNEYIAEE